MSIRTRIDVVAFVGEDVRWRARGGGVLILIFYSLLICPCMCSYIEKVKLMGVFEVRGGGA
jgi:hypothetical protein